MGPSVLMARSRPNYTPSRDIFSLSLPWERGYFSFLPPALYGSGRAVRFRMHILLPTAILNGLSRAHSRR
jgi:hypothetical protein